MNGRNQPIWLAVATEIDRVLLKDRRRNIVLGRGVTDGRTVAAVADLLCLDETNRRVQPDILS